MGWFLQKNYFIRKNCIFSAKIGLEYHRIINLDVSFKMQICVDLLNISKIKIRKILKDVNIIKTLIFFKEYMAEFF